jgi:hypothetical protein
MNHVFPHCQNDGFNAAYRADFSLFIFVFVLIDRADKKTNRKGGQRKLDDSFATSQSDLGLLLLFYCAISRNWEFLFSSFRFKRAMTISLRVSFVIRIR